MYLSAALRSVGDLQFHAAVKNVGFEPIEGLDFRIPGAVSQVFYRNIPEGIAVDNGMNAVVFCRAAQLSFHVFPEGVHALAVLGEPVHHIGVVGSDAFPIAFAVAEDVLLGQAVLLAEVSTKFYRFLVDFIEVYLVGETVFANFKADVGVVAGAAAVPAPMIPGQSLVCSNRAICQLADKGVAADFPPIGVEGVPVIAILVFAKQTIIRPHIPFEIWVVGAGGMNHNPFDGYFPAGFVAGVVGKN